MAFNGNMRASHVRVRRFELAPLALRKEAATWNRAEMQITTGEYLTIKKADLGSSCGLRGPLALLAL